MEKFRNNWKKLILIDNIINIIAVLAFYQLIPNILNYPPDSINNSFQLAINGLTYTQQYASILLLCIIIENIILIVTYSSIKKLLTSMNEALENELGELYLKAEKKVASTPKIIYILQVIVPVIVIALTFAILKGNLVVILKVSLIFFVMLLSIATISYTFSRKIFKDILIDLFYRASKNKIIEKEVLNQIRRTSIRKTVVFIVIPILIVTIVFIAFIGYSQTTKNNGDLLYKLYNSQLEPVISNNITNVDELENTLNNLEFYSLNDEYFIKYPNDKIVSNKEEKLSEFFIEYMKEISSMQKDKNRTYDFYATDYQGIFYNVEINNEIYTIGIRYTTASPYMIKNILIAAILIITIGIILLLYCLNYIFDDIKIVTQRLNKIAKANKVDLKDRIPIASNDEISDLVKAFTSVQIKTNNYIEQIEQDQFAMQRNAQFAILRRICGRTSARP